MHEFREWHVGPRPLHILAYPYLQDLSEKVALGAEVGIDGARRQT